MLVLREGTLTWSEFVTMIGRHYVRIEYTSFREISPGHHSPKA